MDERGVDDGAPNGAGGAAFPAGKSDSSEILAESVVFFIDFG